MFCKFQFHDKTVEDSSMIGVGKIDISSGGNKDEYPEAIGGVEGPM